MLVRDVPPEMAPDWFHKRASCSAPSCIAPPALSVSVCAGEFADAFAPILAFAVDRAGFLDIIHHLARMQFQFDFVRVQHAHEQGLGQRLQVFLAFKTEHHLAAGVRHDGIIHLRAVRSGMKNLARELIGERQVQAEAARLIEVLGNGRGDEILKFINVNIEWLHVAFLHPFAALFGRRPKVAQ